MFYGGPMVDYAEQQARNGAEANLALEALRKELEQTRKEFADYRANNDRKQIEQDAKQSEIEKKNVRRGWTQVIVSCVLSGLIAWAVAHL